MRKKLISLTLLLCMALALCVVFMPLREASANTEPISSVTISITPPIEDAGPDYSPVLTGANDRYFSDSYNTDTYHNDVVWRDMTSGEDLKVDGGRFDPDHTYRVMIFLTPDVGYEFTSSTTATINGIAAEKYVRSDGQLQVWLIFSEVLRYIDSGMYDVQINLSDPVVGEHPDYDPTLLYAHVR